MKAKYFPRSSFLASELGRRPSFIWRSFMAAKDLLSHGIIWRIGDGNSIKIWGDRWLPNIGSLIFSAASSLSCEAKVSDLIDVSVKGWKCSLIDSSFLAYVTNIIKNIPLCPSLPPDKIIWDGTSNGVFSVRSAYHLGWDLLNSKKGECSSSSNRSDFWKKLWAINAPNSLKKNSLESLSKLVTF
jgi:hypothetical protein